MLAAHFSSVERSLLASAGITANSGHNLHRGTPKEAFVQQFLRAHLSGRISVGTGEIIDCSSRPGEARNQQDIVLYRSEHPKLDFGGNIHAYLAESVLATIEVKTRVSYEDVLTATKTAKKLKSLQRHLHNPLRFGTAAPSILTYIVAFEGPANAQTLYGWIQQAAGAAEVIYPSLPTVYEQRIATASTALDGIFVLGKGFVHYDNSPISLVPDEIRGKLPSNWVFCDHEERSLFFLFMLLSQALNNLSCNLINMTAYTGSVQFGAAGLRP